MLFRSKELIEKIKFIRERQFDEQTGAVTLKLVGDVIPIDTTEVVRYEQINLIEKYPYTYTQLIGKIKDRLSSSHRGEVDKIIRENNIKTNSNYSAFNFRSKSHKDDYFNKGILHTGTPSIYNQEAVEYIARVLENN